MNSQARDIILRVLEYFQKEKENKGPLVSVEKVRVRVAAACGISEKSIQRIVKQKEEDGIVSTPGKKRPRLDIVNKMDSFDKDAYRRHIYSYYERKELPTLNKLVVSLGEAGLFSGSRSSLRRILQSLNFRFKKFSSRGVLLEKPHVVNLRVQFLRNVLTMDWEKTVFLDETWVNANHSVAKGKLSVLIFAISEVIYEIKKNLVEGGQRVLSSVKYSTFGQPPTLPQWG